eukprot:710283_1
MYLRYGVSRHNLISYQCRPGLNNILSTRWNSTVKDSTPVSQSITQRLMQTKAKMSRPVMEPISSAAHSVYPRAPAFLKRPLTASIVGAPVSLGQRLVGVENGPDAIRE